MLSYASIYRSSAKTFNYLISKGCDIFCPVDGYADLFEFISNRCPLTVLQNLLEAPKAVNKCKDRGYSPLLAAVTRDFGSAYHTYLDLDLDSDSDSDLDLNLHTCARSPYVFCYLDMSVPHCFTTFDRGTMPALQTAIALERPAVVQALIFCGADVNGKGHFFGNALQCAVALMEVSSIGYLLPEGARMRPEDPEWDAMILAIEEGNYFENGTKAGQLAVERLKLAQTIFGVGDHIGDWKTCRQKFIEEAQRLSIYSGNTKIRWEHLRAYEGQRFPSRYGCNDWEGIPGCGTRKRI